MKSKKEMSIRGYVYNRIEKIGNKNYNHIGFTDKANKFGDMLSKLVPEIGMKKKVKLTIELINDN